LRSAPACAKAPVGRSFEVGEAIVLGKKKGKPVETPDRFNERLDLVYDLVYYVVRGD